MTFKEMKVADFAFSTNGELLAAGFMWRVRYVALSSFWPAQQQASEPNATQVQGLERARRKVISPLSRSITSTV